MEKRLNVSNLGIEEMNTSIVECVRRNVKQYLANLNGKRPDNMYDTILKEVEPSLLKVIMEYAESNQTKAAIYLGISRGSMRKKLKRYGFL